MSHVVFTTLRVKRKSEPSVHKGNTVSSSRTHRSARRQSLRLSSSCPLRLQSPSPLLPPATATVTLQPQQQHRGTNDCVRKCWCANPPPPPGKLNTKTATGTRPTTLYLRGGPVARPSIKQTHFGFHLRLLGSPGFARLLLLTRCTICR